MNTSILCLDLGPPDGGYLEKSVGTDRTVSIASLYIDTIFINQGSSGILELESDSFKLNCSQTLTGIKFIVVSDLKQESTTQQIIQYPIPVIA